ncbi:hypothetical protein [Enterovibrio sp. 27052020O]|uniref:hypothetical protein n=1 Tax=Enterovibrio sp. 27052020O TaxID=3241166 RepID=UPI00388E894A
MNLSLNISLKRKALVLRSHLTLFINYYLLTVLVLMLKGELFNVALRVWSDEPLTFWENGLWQVTLMVSFVVALYVYLTDINN